MTIRRFYPIRMTRNFWQIPLYNKHICSEELCGNKNCNLNNSFTRTTFKIGCNDFGLLFFLNMKVIPNDAFKVKIAIPLSNPVDIEIKNTSNTGFTLKTLLCAIRDAYIRIYQDEERTATPRTYHLRKKCLNCNYKNLEKFIKKYEKKDDTNECIICHTDYNDIVLIGKLACNHYYHYKCIKDWVKTGHNTCPLCRTAICNCEHCNNSRIIYYNSNCVVIPIQERGYFRNRNSTNGIYGIYGYDLQDLFIEEMIYNREKNRLVLRIGI